MQAALLILDGWGLGDDDRRSANGASCTDSRGCSERRNAVDAAATPNFDRIAELGAYSTLETSGRRMGLPNGQMGNSEVGHLTIGAGRVVSQAYTRITDAIAEGDLAEHSVISSAFEHAVANDGRVHFLGLVSDGGVHADHRHLHALIELAAERDIEAFTHAFTDGRDTDPTSAVEYLGELQDTTDEHDTGDVATVSGRYYAMDRDEHWERTERAYDAIVNREAKHTASSATEAVRASYDRDDSDEFVKPTLIEGKPALADGDVALWFNFRADRARQLTRMLADIHPEWGFETDPPDAAVVTMTEYDKTFDLPVAFAPHQPENTLGETLAAAGNTQLRIAESEKYAHVTYFFNGGREVEFDGERRRIIDSPDVPTYDRKPEMSAPAVTDTAIRMIESEDPDVLVLNYANPDMVGHTGDYEATIAACEAVDACLGRLVGFARTAGAEVLITADHGNAEDMGTAEAPHTAHTLNPVPFVSIDPDGTDGGRTVRDGGGLADVAPTVLALIGLTQPAAMTGESLLE